MAYNDVERFVRPSNQRQSIINSIHSCTSIFLQVPIEAEARHPRRQRVSTVPPTVSWAHGMRFSRVFRHSIIPVVIAKARASDRSSDEEVQRVYRQINDRGRPVASLEARE